MSRSMHVYLLRHGEAADLAPDGSHTDERRELTTRGIERLRVACAVHARLIGTPGQVLHSPLIRARQTAEILAEATGLQGTMRELEQLRPSGRASHIVELLQGEFLDNCPSLVLVGHEPLMGSLLGLLATGNDRLSLPMSMGTLAGIRLKEPQVMIGRLVTLLSQDAALGLAG